MTRSILAGKLAPESLLINVTDLETKYYRTQPDPTLPSQKVSFGTSGHRGSPLLGSYTESHILAITQAICDYRKINNITGPLYLGKDTHALSHPSQRTAIEVLIANEVETYIQDHDEVTPTPVISRTILAHNITHESGSLKLRNDFQADGIVITPSHNPPDEGGFKYNPPHGGPADSLITTEIQNRANYYLFTAFDQIKRTSFEQAMNSPHLHEVDFLTPYVEALSEVIQFEKIRGAQIKIGVDPMGGAALRYWEPIKAIYGLNITVVNPVQDPRFSFMCVDHDGKIRMDCSSPDAMASLIQLKNKYQIAFGNDADADRHGIITPTEGLMNPNHYLAASIHYLLNHRPKWKTNSFIGKTLVSSSMIDKVVNSLNRKVFEVPVGFKWFSEGLLNSTLCFAGEESAGASFLKEDGSVWTTDKDGMILNLLASEMTAVTGKNPSELYQQLSELHGTSFYSRVDSPINAEEKNKLSKITGDGIPLKTLAGDAVLEKLTQAKGNQASMGGIKITTQNGWIAVRPSGTEMVSKVYAESFKSEAHLNELIDDAKKLISI